MWIELIRHAYSELKLLLGVMSWRKTNIVQSRFIDLIPWIQITIFNVKWLERAEKNKTHISCELNLFDTRIQCWNVFLWVISCKKTEFHIISPHWLIQWIQIPIFNVQCLERAEKKKKDHIKWIKLIRHAYSELKLLLRINVV